VYVFLRILSVVFWPFYSLAAPKRTRLLTLEQVKNERLLNEFAKCLTKPKV